MNIFGGMDMKNEISFEFEAVAEFVELCFPDGTILRVDRAGAEIARTAAEHGFLKDHTILELFLRDPSVIRMRDLAADGFQCSGRFLRQKRAGLLIAIDPFADEVVNNSGFPERYAAHNPQAAQSRRDSSSNGQ